jgi:hypothetical protein
MNWYIVIPLVIIVFILLVFLVRQNVKDEKELRNKLNNDYRKPKKTGGDLDNERALNE